MRYFYIVLILFLSKEVFAQQGVTTFGMQIKPIVPVGYFGTGATVQQDGRFTLTTKQNIGVCYGMVVRQGITKSISFESGINYIKRNYNLHLEIADTNFFDKSNFGIVSYEIPLQGLVYIRLSENLFINSSTGISFNFFASSVQSLGENKMMQHLSLLRRRSGLSYLANLGFEYRTEKSGYIYLGSSLHLPFNPITRYTNVSYEDRRRNDLVYFKEELRGSFLTLDIRYFFHEDPAKKKVKKKPD
jgi:hypothetical protein